MTNYESHDDVETQRYGIKEYVHIIYASLGVFLYYFH